MWIVWAAAQFIGALLVAVCVGTFVSEGLHSLHMLRDGRFHAATRARFNAATAAAAATLLLVLMFTGPKTGI